MIHYMKLKKDPFEAIRSGEKIYELRLLDVKKKTDKGLMTILFSKNLKIRMKEWKLLLKGCIIINHSEICLRKSLLRSVALQIFQKIWL